MIRAMAKTKSYLVPKLKPGMSDLLAAIHAHGSMNQLARHLSVSQPAISYWLKKGVPRWWMAAVKKAATAPAYGARK